MAEIAVLSDGTKLSELKSKAKVLKKRERISHAQALSCLAKEKGFENWDDLSKSAWRVDADGYVCREKLFEISRFGLSVPTDTPLFPPANPYNLFANAEGITVSCSPAPYGMGHVVMSVRFSPYDIFGYQIDHEDLVEIRETVASESRSKRAALQGRLMEKYIPILTKDSQFELTCSEACQFMRQEQGISDLDLYWGNWGLETGYEPEGWKIDVFKSGKDELLVCFHSDSVVKEVLPFGFVEKGCLKNSKRDLRSRREIMLAYMEAAGILDIDF